jgi:hypothetical protein
MGILFFILLFLSNLIPFPNFISWNGSNFNHFVVPDTKSNFLERVLQDINENKWNDFKNKRPNIPQDNNYQGIENFFTLYSEGTVDFSYYIGIMFPPNPIIEQITGWQICLKQPKTLNKNIKFWNDFKIQFKDKLKEPETEKKINEIEQWFSSDHQKLRISFQWTKHFYFNDYDIRNIREVTINEITDKSYLDTISLKNQTKSNWTTFTTVNQKKINSKSEKYQQVTHFFNNNPDKTLNFIYTINQNDEITIKNWTLIPDFDVITNFNLVKWILFLLIVLISISVMFYLIKNNKFNNLKG